MTVKYPVVDEVIERCVQYFRNNRSYIQLDEIQKSRCNINLISVDVTTVRDTVELKHMVYNDLHKHVYITLPIKYIVTGERVHPREIKKIRYNIIKMLDTIDRLENMADVFVDGNKLPIKDVSIALFDDYFVLQIPYKYKTAKTIDVLIRPTLMERYSSTNSIDIQKTDLVNKDINDFMAYVDGKLTEKISVLEYDKHYTYRCNETVTSNFELCFIRNLVKYGNVNINNSNYLRLANNVNKMPIVKQHILPFRLKDNGKLHNLNLVAKTSNVFKCNSIVNNDYDIYYVYEELASEDVMYHDNYKWYIDHVLKGNNLNDLDSPNAPDFIKAFKLFTKDISLSNYVDEKYRDLLSYNYDKLKQSIEYDQELMIIYRTFIYEAMKNHVLKESDFLKIDARYLKDNARENNKSEIIDVSIQSDFPTTMLLFKIPNYDNHHINIYVNGLRNHFHSWEGSELGITYIYLMKNRVPEGSVVEIERFKFPKSKPRSLTIVGSGTSNINIDNARISGLVNANGLYNINILDNNGEAIDINHINLDKNNDMLNILTSKQLDNGHVYTVANMNYVNIFKYETRHKGSNLVLDITSMGNSSSDKSCLRVYKNGRELPRDVISIRGNTLTLSIRYTIYELIEVEYSPIQYKEMYDLREIPIGNNGELDLYGRSVQDKSLQHYSNNIGQYITVNGRKLDYEHYKYWCSQGATIHDISSRKWCRIINEYYEPLEKVLDYLLTTFKASTHLFDEFMVRRMKGGPITDTENDCVEENIERVGELYYDLYREFLKHNILNLNDSMPEYIAIKYSGLVDTSKNNSIMVDTHDKQLYWMPLDASMKHEEDLIRIMGLYYKLLDDMAFVQVIDPDNIPPDIYEKYKELFDNNVLVLQIPDIPPM